MNRTLSCPGCRTALLVSDQMQGGKVRCPRCKHILEVGSPGPEPFPAPTEPYPPPLPEPPAPAAGPPAEEAPLELLPEVLPTAEDSDEPKLTQLGVVAGTPAFLSPEQARGRKVVDARSDLYSVGALAYYLLTGRPPFSRDTGVEVIAAHLYEKPEPPSRHRPDVPADLEAVVLRCLAKDPDARYPDAKSLNAALASCGAAGAWTATQSVG